MIMPLLCQIFLSNNKDAHKHLARGGKEKDTLIILVPEHLLPDARTQVFRHCLNLNFRQDYRIFDDILSLLHKDVSFIPITGRKQKQIFVTSFNQFKKALTYGKICKKIRPHREHILVVADEVDDFLGKSEFCFLLLLLFHTADVLIVHYSIEFQNGTSLCSTSVPIRLMRLTAIHWSTFMKSAMQRIMR